MTWIADGLRSLIGALGAPERDKAAAAYFAGGGVTSDELAAAYESNWIARKCVDIPARDALREWRVWHGDASEAIHGEEKRLRLREKVLEAQIKARLFGNAALYIGVDDQDAATPLDVEKIRPGGLRYVTVLARRELTAAPIELDPLSEHYGRPKHYEISGGRSRRAVVHPSRLAIFRGDARADTWGGRDADVGWDQSVLLAVLDAIKQASGANANIASLIYEANVDVIGIPDLSTKVRTSDGEAALLRRFSVAARGKGVNGMLILDKEEEYQRRSASFSDLTPLMETFALFCAAGADIPATRFLARSPSGLSATGTSDTKNYFDKLRSMQTLEIAPTLERPDACLLRSAGAPPEATYDWNPLEREDRESLAQVGKATAETLAIMAGLGITGEELRELTIHRMAETGVFPHILEVTERTRARLALDPVEEDPDPSDDDTDERPARPA